MVLVVVLVVLVGVVMVVVVVLGLGKSRNILPLFRHQSLLNNGAGPGRASSPTAPTLLRLRGSAPV